MGANQVKRDQWDSQPPTGSHVNSHTYRKPQCTMPNEGSLINNFIIGILKRENLRSRALQKNLDYLVCILSK